MLKCPQCGATEGFRVQAAVQITLMEGRGPATDATEPEWDTESEAICESCGWATTVWRAMEVGGEVDG